MPLIKTQIEVSFDTNDDIRSEINKKRKFERLEMTKERFMGTMIEDHFKLQKLLTKKKITFEELLIDLKS